VGVLQRVCRRVQTRRGNLRKEMTFVVVKVSRSVILARRKGSERVEDLRKGVFENWW
jgi:hypothetical protein